MSWSRGLKTKALLLTPRDCPKCGQHMSAEYLEQREAERARKVSESLKRAYAERRVSKSKRNREGGVE